MSKYSSHDKRVTTRLARLSTVADQDPTFAGVLDQLVDCGFDVHQLDAESQELLTAYFDVELERRIIAEFEADPSYVIDLGKASGVCPLCGHQGCRWIFRITNVKNGQSIDCGSECIVTHGLAVKGAETAEHARKALEATIRRAQRAIKIEAWHQDMGFDPKLFEVLAKGLYEIQHDDVLPYKVTNSAYYKLVKDLPKLVKFYQRHGWLNTKKRWAEWTRLVGFARKFDPATRKAMSYPLPHGFKTGQPVKVIDAAPKQVLSDAEVEAIEDAAKAQKETPKAPQSIQQELPFASIAHELLFGL